ncbi:hypothetical protein HPB48_006502 [Haemaphysalis longicornis]|uniref:Sulfatase N-terminal domain-containing protein n=1 Tax=Haemaphysalis longicornis TaxID=44386 RepID=A0A9J6GQU9_HAELO|nr:hypothetical protein HPB48_006502 [Haemaphysalis longicornis]
MVDALDKSIGALMEALEAESMLENTIIVFSSDNGGDPYTSVRNTGYNWPLRGIKSTLWEGSVRVPAFLWNAQLVQSPRVSNQLMHITDWLPTLYSAAGGDVTNLGALDGFDMWQALSLNLLSPRTEILLNIDNELGVAALRYGEFKLVVGSNGDASDDRFPIPGFNRPVNDLDFLLQQSKTAAVLRRFYADERPVGFGINVSRQSVIVTCGNLPFSDFVTGEIYYLFHLAQDPCELHNIALQRPDVSTLLSTSPPSRTSDFSTL